MALYKGGILGPVRNKVGSVVGRVWRTGKYVLAAMPASVKNPRTQAQQLIRARFSALGEMGGAFLSAIGTGLRGTYMARQSTAVGEFVRLNWGVVQATVADGVTIDYTGIRVAKGPLTNVAFGTAQFDTPQTVDVSFTTMEEIAGTSLDDKVYVFCYCPDAKAGIMADPVKRSARSVSVLVPAQWNGMKVHLWGFSVGDGLNNKGRISNSTYLGSGNIS